MMRFQEAERIFKVIFPSLFFSRARRFNYPFGRLRQTIRLLGHSKEIDRTRMQICLLRKTHLFGRRFADGNGLAVFFLLFLSQITNRTGFFTMYIFDVRVIVNKTEIYYPQCSLRMAWFWCVSVYSCFTRSHGRDRSRDGECISSKDFAAVPF